ncbi:hypothetical protein ACOMHN_059008 [Nucella lapillus]
MVEQNAGKFISSLIKSLQMVCHGYMDFSDNIEIIGHINLRIDNRQKFDYIVNEQVSKKGGESTVFLSNSYHSLPPGKGSGGERERSFSNKFEEDGNVNNHHRLDESLGGSRVQVDLSGPVPVTRSTSAPSHDGFFSTAGNNLRRSQSRDSRLHSMEEEPALASSLQDHSFNHSSSASSKDREQMEREEAGQAGNRGGGTAGERNEHNSVLAMYKDTALSRQQGLDHRQDVIVKPEPNDIFNSSMDDMGGLMRDSDVLDASSTSSVLPAAHQSATVLATAAHTGHAMLATTLGHPGFFDASLTSQDVADTGEGSYHSVSLSKERNLGQNLSEQSSHNGDGEAMSLVTRARTPPDLSYPQGPTQLPQTANIVEKEVAPVPEKNHCSHCSKNFRTSDLLSMHIALIHTRRNYLPPKSLLSSPSYLSSSSMSPSQSQAGMTRRASQSPGHQSTSSNSSRSKSQSPISMMSHSQPLALIQPMTTTAPQLTSSPSCLGMALPNLPNTMSSTACHDLSSVNVTAATIAALAQSYAYDPPQVGPMMGGQVAGSLQGSSHQCHLCHMPFVSWALLAQHQSNCPRRGPHRCEQCGKAFRSKTSLTDHINTIHRGVLFICRGCRETFKWRTHIYQHKRKCPALVNLTFETGSFIEEVYPPNPPPEVPPTTSMVQMPAENMVATEQMN